MEELSRLHELREEHDRLKADLISAELSLAITFCEVALSNRAIADKGVQNARRAREGACHELEGAPLEPSERQEIEEKLGRLAGLLEKLDQPLGKRESGARIA